MRASASPALGVTQTTRHLYLVPERAFTRAPYAPPMRTLHLVDIENLMGGPLEGTAELEAASLAYRAAAAVDPNDHVVVASNPALCVDVHRQWPACRLLAKSGPDGADIALVGSVDDVEWIAARYDRIIIGSGDGMFAGVAQAYVRAGLAVGVVAKQGCLSRALAEAASFVSLIDVPLQGVVK